MSDLQLLLIKIEIDELHCTCLIFASCELTELQKDDQNVVDSSNCVDMRVIAFRKALVEVPVELVSAYRKLVELIIAD